MTNNVAASFSVALRDHGRPEEQIFLLAMLVFVLLSARTLGRRCHDACVMDVVASVAVGADAGADHLLAWQAFLWGC